MTDAQPTRLREPRAGESCPRAGCLDWGPWDRFPAAGRCPLRRQ